MAVADSSPKENRDRASVRYWSFVSLGGSRTDLERCC